MGYSNWDFQLSNKKTKHSNKICTWIQFFSFYYDILGIIYISTGSILVDLGHTGIVWSHDNVELLISAVVAVPSVIFVDSDWAQKDASHRIQPASHNLWDLIPSLLPQVRQSSTGWSAHPANRKINYVTKGEVIEEIKPDILIRILMKILMERGRRAVQIRNPIRMPKSNWKNWIN